MAHTTECGLTRFIHNGDYSGSVQMVEKDTGREFMVPMEDLVGFVVGGYLRSLKVRDWENAADEYAQMPVDDLLRRMGVTSR